MRIFVSGPMTGYENYNFPEFERVERLLEARGHEVVSMRKVVVEEWNGDTNRSRPEFMREAIQRLMTCDALYSLEFWIMSEGAQLERKIARQLDLDIYSYVLEDFVKWDGQ